MPTPHREDVAERRRNERKEQSPYNQAGRKKMFISRWSPSIRNALSRLWYGESTTVEEPEKNTDEPQDKEVNEISGDDESDSAMNASTMSEDQVLTQLTMPSSRHVRFDLPSFSGHTQPETAGPSTPVRPLPVPYVAPIPPSSIHMQQPNNSDPAAKVRNYLETVVIPRGGECTEVEVLGLSMLLQSTVPGSPFPSASSPEALSSLKDTLAAFNAQVPLKPMFTTPNTDIGAILAASATSRTSSPQRASPSRTLKQNPNGRIFFEGGGSARRRYRSPSLGTSSPWSRHTLHGDFSKPLSDNANENEPSSPTDGKRRRVGEDVETSVAEPSGSISQPNGAGDDTVDSTPSNGLGSSSHSAPPSMSAPSTRVAFSRFTAATPARPSPLRQSVRADSSSPGSSSGGSPGTSINTGAQPTTSSDFIAAAIRTVTPKNPPPESNELTSSPENAFRNPYQQSTRHTRKLATKPLRPPPKPSRQPEASTKQPSPPPKKQSALEYIQTSAPTNNIQTGLKRSHEEAKTNGIASSSNIRPVKATVIEVSDEEESRPQKKQKQEVDTGKEKEKVKAPQEVIIIDDDEDVVMQAKEPIRPAEVIEPDAEKVKVKEKAFPKRFPSAPKEPSPLRQSFQPDVVSSDSESQRPDAETKVFAAGIPGFRTTMIATPPAFSPAASSATSGGTRFGTSNLNPPSVPHPFGPPSASTSTTSSTFPAFNPTPSIPAFGGFPSAFSPSARTSGGSPTISQEKKPAAFQMPPKDPVPTSAAPLIPAMKIVEAPSPSTSNPSTGEILARGKRMAAAVPISELPGFDFTVPHRPVSPKLAAARQISFSKPRAELPSFKLDSLPATSSISTGTQPPVSVFSVISTPQPAIDIVPRAEVKGFDWSAAGLKKPSFQGWMCTTCFLNNKDEKTKCESCTSERPGAITTATTAPSNSIFNGTSIKPVQDAAPKAEIKGFDWSAAGLKKPSSQGWTCTTCFLDNKDEETKCESCTSKRPGTITTATTTPSNSIFNGTSIKPGQDAAPKAEIKGFDWSAAGLTKPVTQGWKCSTCFLDNMGDVTECTVCKTAKPGSTTTSASATASSAPPSFGSFSAIAKPSDSFAPKSEKKGFDWSAAGLKMPVSEGWKCPDCLLQNKDDVTKCICSKEKPGTIATETSSSDAKPKATFDWSAGRMNTLPTPKNTSAKVPPSAGTIPTFGNFSIKPAVFPTAPNPVVPTAGTSSSPFGPIPLLSGYSFVSKPPADTSSEAPKVEDTNSKEEDGDVK